jgi:beta-phosphoglucomutase-like phosphatase (HAD superfamily)
MRCALLDAEDVIDAATFAGDVKSSKPAPDLEQVALDRVGVPTEEAVFTGDTVWDVEACQKAGVPCIGLLTGGISGDELTAAEAAEVYPAPADLLAALHGSLLGRRERSGPARALRSTYRLTPAWAVMRHFRNPATADQLQHLNLALS